MEIQIRGIRSPDKLVSVLTIHGNYIDRLVAAVCTRDARFTSRDHVLGYVFCSTSLKWQTGTISVKQITGKAMTVTDIIEIKDEYRFNGFGASQDPPNYVLSPESLLMNVPVTASTVWLAAAIETAAKVMTSNNAISRVYDRLTLFWNCVNG